MGLFSFLFGKKKDSKPLIPAIKLQQELKDTFSETFRLHVSSLGCFSNDEIEEMVSFMANIPNGFINRGAWHSPLYDKYFIDREWSWPLLEEWRDTLIKREAYWSSRWFPNPDNEEIPFFRSVVGKLNVADIRFILKQTNIKAASKAKRGELVDLFEKSINLEWLEQHSEKWNKATLEVKEAEEEFKRYGFKYEEFCMLLSHIRTHAKNLEDLRMFEELGVPHTLMFLCGGATGMKALAEELHKQNLTAIPPFFPDDRTALKIDFTSFAK